MKLHERTIPVQQAQNEMASAVLDVIKKYDLTFAEIFSCLNYVEGNWIKYAIREERHPGEDKRGDEA